MIIKDSPTHGKGVFAKKGIKPGKSWTFSLKVVCCEAHCFAIGNDKYYGTFDWPFYINSTWPNASAANLTFEINGRTLIITALRFIKKGEELTLPYDWTIHRTNCYEDTNGK